jgi:hypothetical protein
LRPVFGIGVMVTAGSRRSARNNVMPSVRLAHSSSGVVRHSNSTRSASRALDVHTLRPRIRYPPSGSRYARALIEGVSLPASGSVTPKATCRSPLATRGRYRSRISSEPCSTTGCIPKIDRWTAEQPFMAAPEAATSSRTTDASLMPRPPPPYRSGIAMPTQPPSAIAP